MEIIIGILIVSVLAVLVSFVVHRFLNRIFYATIISVLTTPVIFHLINRAVESYSIDYPDPIESFVLLIVTAYAIIPCVVVSVLIKKQRHKYKNHKRKI